MPGGDRQGWRRGAGLTAGTGRHRPAARLGPRPKCFLVPVINLWWPYQSTRDLLPAALTTLAGLAARQVVANALAAHQVLASRRY